MAYKRANGAGEFYSRSGRGDFVELWLDADGQPTIDYPHVHVIHHSSGLVEVLPSFSKGVHGKRKVMNNPSGQAVEAAILEVRTALRQLKIYPIRGAGQAQVGSITFERHKDGWVCVRIFYAGQQLQRFSYKPDGTNMFITIETGQELSELPPGGKYDSDSIG